MIVDTVGSFVLERNMVRLATLPRQAEWEAYVSQFQGCAAGASSAEKWQLMEKILIRRGRGIIGPEGGVYRPIIGIYDPRP